MNKPSIHLLSERMKQYEEVFTEIKIPLDEIVCVRIDGKGFSNLTRTLKGAKRPYHEEFAKIMIDTMNFLVSKTQAKLGYTQSDEITLIYFNKDRNQMGAFNNKVQKLCSVFASMATAKFNQELHSRVPEKKSTLAFFDGRAFAVPDLTTAANLIFWRQEDAIKNSISMAAESYFSHRVLLKKNSQEKINLLKDAGVIFEEYPAFFRIGTFANNEGYMVEVNLNNLPPKALEQLGGQTHVLRHRIKNNSCICLRDINPEAWVDLLFNNKQKEEI